jgi:cyanate permease
VKPPLSAELQRSYAEAIYIVDWGRQGLRLSPGERVPHWTLHFGHQPAAFITACNPYSQRASEAENAAAMARLRDRVARLGLPWLQGEGRSPGGDWPAEASLLVLGIDTVTAHRLAEEFCQHAILVVDAEGAVSLESTP